MRTSQQRTGDRGEREIRRRAPCPNCGKALAHLPTNFPLYDLQCEGCSFRAQVKTCVSSPKDIVRGAGWDIIRKVLKAGFLAPPLIVNFRCASGSRRKSEILFFPFVTKKYMEHYRLGENHRQKNYRMFNYVNLKSLPHFQLTQHGKWIAGSPVLIERK